MNVDEAMAYASKDKCFWTGEVHTALETLSKEVERLRAELTIREQEVICVRNSQSLELANCKEDNERLREALFEMQQAAIRLVGHIDEAKAELAEAKAASACPVEIESVYVNEYLGSVVVFIGNERGAVEFDAWLCDRVKDTTPPTT